MRRQAEKDLAEAVKQYGLQKEEMEALRKEMMKHVKKINYEAHYPVPDSLKQQQLKYPNACFIQILGGSQRFQIIFYCSK